MSHRTRLISCSFLALLLTLAVAGMANAGYTRSNDGHGYPDKHAHPGHKKKCNCDKAQGHSNNGTPAGDQQGSPGMPTYYISPMLISLTVEDTPLPWKPAIGPALDFTLSYNQMDIDQPATFGWSNIGPKWTFNWLSYVQDDPAAPGRKVLTYMPGGPGRPEQGFNANTGLFAPEVEFGAQLVEVSTDPVVYERRFADGSKAVYAESDDATIYPRHIFLTRRVDAHGNAVTLHYDDRHRLTRMTDAFGHALTLLYADTGHPLRVTGASDDTGRSITLDYDASGRLAGITDVMGMTSIFAYDSGTSITAMTTPYGVTRFDTHQQGVRRWIDITDANGGTSRWEFNEAVSGVPFSASHVPHGIRAFNRYLNSRDSFYWDAVTFKRFGGDYTKALNYHWTHKSQGGRLSSVTADTLESVKYPLESRIWYNHPGDIAGGSGRLNVPTAEARVLPDGSTQFRQKSYDAQGRLTRSIDPAGLETDYTYASNGIDVVKIERKGSDGTDSVETFTYNDQHKVLTHTDETGAVTRFTYNGQGQVLTRTDALGHVTRYTYDAQGNKTLVTDANGHTTRFTYDGLGRQTSRTDALGRTSRYKYDKLNRRIRTTYPDGSYTTTTWNKLDKTAVRDRNGHVTHYTYDAMRHRTSSTDPLGHVTRWTYYPNGLLKSRIDAEGHATIWQRDIEGRVTAVTDAEDHTTRFAYDSADRRIKVTNALGQVTATTYDKMNQPTRVTDANGVMTDNTYTSRGWPATRTVHAPSVPDATTTFTYDAHGDRVALTDADGVKTTFVYDTAHRLSAINDAQGNTRVFTRDAMGNLTAMAYAAADNTDIAYLHRYSYDAANQRIESVDAEGHVTRYRYDVAGHLRDMRDPTGVHTLTHFDPEGHLLQSVQGVHGHHHDRWWQGRHAFGRDTAKVGYTYDADGHLVSVTDPDSLVTRYTYDANSRKIQQVSPDTGLTTYAYDAVGNLVHKTDARGVETDNAYDALKRLVSVHYPSDPSEDIHFHYGDRNDVTGCKISFPVGHLTRMLDASGSTTYCYDARGNLIAEHKVIAGHSYDLAWTWTPANRLASMTYPDGVHVSYTRNLDGRATSVALQGPHDATARTVVSAITYLPFGPVSQMVYGQGQLSLARRYDGNYRGTAIDGLGLHLKVKRDPNGNIVAVRTRGHQHLPTERYRYDALQRLTAVTGSWGYLKQHYRYNATGDRLSKVTATDGAVRYRYQPDSHKLAAIGHGLGWGRLGQGRSPFCGWPFRHTCRRRDGTVLTDANGNQIRMPHQGQELNLTYGANNRLTQVATAQGGNATYLYDGRGLRVEKHTTNPAQTRDFLYQSTRLVSEGVPGSDHERDYVWLDHTLVASVDTTSQGTQIHYVATDFLGTPRQVTDTHGAAVWSWPYTGNPFGEREAHGSYHLNLRFPGQYYDNLSAFAYNINRYYVSSSGRYIKPDPTGVQGGFDPYTYVSSKPMDAKDPLGLFKLIESNYGWGGVYCDYGTWKPFVITPDFYSCKIITACAYVHEEEHIRQVTGTSPRLCAFYKPMSWGMFLGYSSTEEMRADESMAYRKEISCLEKYLKNMKCSNNECSDEARRRIHNILYVIAPSVMDGSYGGG